jgi:CPA2 family monovalent cation:H+ antiporter-2
MSRSAGLTSIEEFPKRLKIFFVVIVCLFILGTLGFKIISNLSFSDSLLRTTETLAFMFEENSTVSERLLEVFLALVGVFLIWWVLWSVADMLLAGNLGKYLKTRLYSLKIGNMKNHIIIAGGGRVGEGIAKTLTKKKANFLILESNEKVANSLRKKGYITVLGDASSEPSLKEAEIESAKKLIITLPEGKTNILITLAAKEISPEIEVYSRCENPSLIPKLKKVGAKVVVVPEMIAADKIVSDLGI